MARLAAVAAAPLAFAPGTRRATLYKNPQCDCCDEYASYLRRHGFEVEVVGTEDIDAFMAPRGELLGGCHPMWVGGYVVEGHVPVGAIEKLLAARPRIAGISLPGMPSGAPGMPGEKKAPFRVMTLGGGEAKVFWIE